MRQGQQNRRGRGRNNNNNRKGQNPLTRSFESNGPDMKIRGTPAHIAEKYMSLARDALSSGDPVLAENYLQHAEHYNRIIMAYREQQMGQGGDNANAQPRPRHASDGDDVSVNDGDDATADQSAAPPGSEPQPNMAEYEGASSGSEGRHQGGRGEGRNSGRRGRSNGGDRPSRGRQASNGHQSDDQPSSRGRSGDRDRFGESGEQPDFLKRPIRRPRRTTEANHDEAPAEAAPAPAEENQD